MVDIKELFQEQYEEIFTEPCVLAEFLSWLRKSDRKLAELLDLKFWEFSEFLVWDRMLSDADDSKVKECSTG